MVALETTRLDTVNVMLASIGEQPVNSLTPKTPDSAIAETLLDEEDRTVQILGWWWNTESDTVRTPNASGEFTAEADWISIDAQQRYGDRRLIIRNGKIYDLNKQTFDLDLPELKFDIIRFLDFETALPEAARKYISARAVRRFVDVTLADDKRTRTALLVEEQAQLALKKFEDRKGRYSALNNTNARMIAGRATGDSTHLPRPLGTQ